MSRDTMEMLITLRSEIFVRNDSCNVKNQGRKGSWRCLGENGSCIFDKIVQ